MIWKLFRSLLFQIPPETAHHLGGFALRIFGFFTQGRRSSFRPAARYRFELAGHRLDSPLGVAAGFDKDGKILLGLHSLGFSYVEVGSVTLRPQGGNPAPRLFRLPEARALINRMGFNSEGADVVADRLEHARAMRAVQFPIGVNIGKNRMTPLERAAEDYVAALEILYSAADYLVINLSSPNTPGLTSLQEGEHLRPLLRAVREKRDLMESRQPGPMRPLFLKISPDLSFEAGKTAVDEAMDAGFSGIIATNTSRQRELPGLEKADKRLVEQEGGLSGAPLRGLAKAWIREIRGWMGPKATLISVGGLDGPEDARERIAAGADLLQVYTEFVYGGPFYPRSIARAFRS